MGRLCLVGYIFFPYLRIRFLINIYFFFHHLCPIVDVLQRNSYRKLIGPLIGTTEINRCKLLKWKHSISTPNSLYRSPSQTADNFDSFLDNLKLNLDAMTDNNLFLVVAIGDFNARWSSWCINDKSNYQGTKIDCLATAYALKQVINEPTHLLKNSSSCIDLIFTSQPNLVMDAGIHPSLHASCHHQIVYAKFNLKIHYPPPYEREVWHFQKADINLIRRAMNEFKWERAFFNLNINETVSVFNTTIKNMMVNFIPHGIIICDDRDSPRIYNRIKINLRTK